MVFMILKRKQEFTTYNQPAGLPEMLPPKKKFKVQCVQKKKGRLIRNPVFEDLIHKYEKLKRNVPFLNRLTVDSLPRKSGNENIDSRTEEAETLGPSYLSREMGEKSNTVNSFEGTALYKTMQEAFHHSDIQNSSDSIIYVDGTNFFNNNISTNNSDKFLEFISEEVTVEHNLKKCSKKYIKTDINTLKDTSYSETYRDKSIFHYKNLAPVGQQSCRVLLKNKIETGNDFFTELLGTSIMSQNHFSYPEKYSTDFWSDHSDQLIYQLFLNEKSREKL